MTNVAHDKHYTYDDYLTWDDDVRCELIYGQIFMMAAPSAIHQEILVKLVRRLGNFLEGKSCRVYPAPFDVRLDFDNRNDTVVQPDISVICDRSKIDKRGCKGAPDLVVEILSPSSIHHDSVVKLELYRQAGVREYWLVDYESKSIRVHTLENGRYYITVYIESGKIDVGVLEGLEIDVNDVFEGVGEIEGAVE